MVGCLQVRDLVLSSGGRGGGGAGTRGRGKGGGGGARPAAWLLEFTVWYVCRHVCIGRKV